MQLQLQAHAVQGSVFHKFNYIFRVYHREHRTEIDLAFVGKAVFFDYLCCTFKVIVRAAYEFDGITLGEPLKVFKAHFALHTA